MQFWSIKNPTVQWRAQLINDERARLSQTFKKVEEAEGLDGRLAAIQKKVRELSNESELTAENSLTLFLSIMFALTHHERHGGVSPSELRKLIYVAHGILQANGIQPMSSKLAFLYGELHLVQSQISMRDGHFWRSSWEQQLASYLSGAQVPGGEKFQALSLGIRAQRLGNAAFALRHFHEAQEGDVADSALEKAKIGYLRTLRLSHRLSEATQLIANYLKGDQSEAFQKEVIWERLCCDLFADESNNLLPMLNMVSRKGTHYEESYILEAFLWTRSVSSIQWLDSLPKLATLTKNKQLDIDRKSFLFQCAQTLEEAYDNQIPLPLRLQKMGEMLEDVQKLRNIDKELLVWLATARWLARNKNFVLAAYTYLEYQAISLRLSEGRSGDVLGVAEDLADKNWLKNLTAVPGA